MKFEWSPHIALDVRNFNKAIDFYKNVIGLENLPDEENDCTPPGGSFKMGGFTLHVSSSDKSDFQESNVWFEFKVDNLKDAIERLKTAECKIGSTSSGSNFKGQYITDPYGMNFHVIQKV